MKRNIAGLILGWAAFSASIMAGLAESPGAGDPTGILRKPVPDKLVVLTFDDGCASHATVAAPILKSMGFGGSFYVCDFDSFHTRKDWYLTYRQMKAMAEDGFEIGNHTKGHAGGAAIRPFLEMEDQLLANHVPKPTTIAWPVFQVNTATYPELSANGYIFGRGGHNRAYRPTVDNPFDIPCLYCGTMEDFVKCVRQASGGRIAVMTFHGTPDMEHPAVSLEPALFTRMMTYLKDNHYKVIALRDLAEYIDPAKAAKLPPTASDFRDPAAPPLAEETSPYVASSPAGAGPGGAAKAVASAAKDLLAFGLPDLGPALISGTSIVLQVPAGTDLTKLAPVFTVSPLAAAVPVSGSARDFSKPQAYVVTAQDGSSRSYTVTVDRGGEPAIFTWNSAASGNWSERAKWSNPVAAGAAPLAGGRKNLALNFGPEGKFSVTNDLGDDFVLNQLNSSGGSVKVEGRGLAFATNGAADFPPRINLSAPGEVVIDTPLKLDGDLAVTMVSNSPVTLAGPVSGGGALVKDGEGQLRVSHKKNTYSGGTVINRGSLYLFVADEGLGSGPVMLNSGGSLDLEHVNGSNPLVLNGGTINAGNGFGNSWSGTITTTGNTNITVYAEFVISAAISGPGGLSHIGGIGAFGPANSGVVTLTGTNTYTGPTVARRGVLRFQKAAALYNGDTASWTPRNISVHPAATMVLNAGGPGELSGGQVGTLIRNLAGKVNDNGLMALSVLCLDTSRATEPVVVSEDISDSKGPGGGAFFLKKCGAGTMRFTGTNRYTGKTTLEGGMLGVASLNSVGNGKPASSLGAPVTVENGEIFIGSGDGEAGLIYTGDGESTDRVMNFAGRTSTVVFDHSGTGLWKFTSPFVISGYGADKTIALRGDTAGTGEIAGPIFDPYDRAGKATTSVTKAGSGTWLLSGKNTYTGPTTVTKGILAVGGSRGLGETSGVAVFAGAFLALDFTGETRVRKLVLDGKEQPAGTYAAKITPEFIKGTGTIKVQPQGSAAPGLVR